MHTLSLVSVGELSAHLNDWRVVDCRHNLQDTAAGERAYRQGHVPGAAFAHLDRDLSGTPGAQRGRHPLPDPEAFAGTLEQLGIDHHTRVVAYDDAGGMFAARLWWMLRWFGHDQAAVLDGGWHFWCAQGCPVSRDPFLQPTVAKGSWARRDHLMVSTEEVQAHLHDPAACLVDARAADRFRGENETLDPVGGHIPGALNRPFRDNLQADGRFKSPEVLKQEFMKLLAGRLSQEVVHQCGSGVTACHNLLAMEWAGLPGGRLYPGSWSAWCADPLRPVATGSTGMEADDGGCV